MGHMKGGHLKQGISTVVSIVKADGERREEEGGWARKINMLLQCSRDFLGNWYTPSHFSSYQEVS